MIYIHRKLGSFGPHWNRDGAQNQSSRGAASRRAFYATRLVTTSSSALPRNVPPTTSIPQACPYCRMLGGSKPSPSGEGFSVLNHSPGRNRGSSAVLPRSLFHTVEPRAASAGCLIEPGNALPNPSMLFSPFWVKGSSLFSFLGVWGKPRWSWTANWSRSFVRREKGTRRGKGTSLNSTCLTPKPLASSVYVHVPEAPSPHERSILVMSLFPFPRSSRPAATTGATSSRVSSRAAVSGAACPLRLGQFDRRAT